jgi:hypothetical protein
MINNASAEEYNTKLNVYDIKDKAAGADGIIVVGGFVGELIITFTCMLDYILASPANQNFMFTVDSVEQFLRDLLSNEEAGFPDEICKVNINKPIEEISEDVEDFNSTARAIANPANQADFGLQFLFDIQKELVLSPDVIDVVFKSIAKLSSQQPAEAVPEPTLAEGATEEQTTAHEEEVEKVKE